MKKKLVVLVIGAVTAVALAAVRQTRRAQAEAEWRRRAQEEEEERRRQRAWYANNHPFAVSACELFIIIVSPADSFSCSNSSSHVPR